MGAFFVIFAGLLTSGIPIALTLGIAGTAYLYLSGNGMMALMLPQRMMAGIDQFVLLTIPLFLLAGALMNVGGVTDRIVHFARAMVGHRRGGMSSVSILSSGFFAGISGSATAEASALGSILIPTMSKQGMPTAYAAALIAVSSVMGPIIPPSITMIIYGVLSGTSIGQLFLAGVVPGIGIATGLLLYASWRAKRDGFPVTERMVGRDRWKATIRTLPALLLPAIILVGIKTGVFTPTEAAAVAVAYALLIGFIYRDLNFRRLWESLIATTLVSASILFITSMASIVSFVFTLEQVPQHIADLVLTITDEPLLILLLLNIFLLLLGMFLEPISILILTMPILLKFQALIDMDPVQFGTVVVLNVVIGMATPPVGILLFITSAISGEPVTKVIREAVPLIGICLAILALIALVPTLSLFLPKMLF
ncbi:MULTISPECIES: TRAP transporter large permease [Roseobacteraceae]|mgnify:CR=1 FL=1|jgi:tripartite ATP-independent transporter DctM subunit|uniref:TRAP transporter large permease protein n=1 Tax=Pseudosulfitobacter pseudonitzschiae TaxID=1402135 RepID=A0A221K8E9_9RHOB|nr:MULTISPECIES: TRAP transporter large permease [Roseobacteraceae]ASM75127.1 C4-dicarboxylate TRAP transporter large permease protein DctM [Pseudosulfitobacter pseudonitzschiae]|tara:strand:+ start:2545 stop:3816 length:1272 start_codon:yes stop_codon:yes gene_type:complete